MKRAETERQSFDIVLAAGAGVTAGTDDRRRQA
jgi:hypothetical protein